MDKIIRSSAFAKLLSRLASSDSATKLPADEPGEAPKRKFWSEDGSLKQDRDHGFSRGVSLFIILVLSVILPVLSSAEVKIGESAPDFTLTDSNDQQRSLSEFAGKYIVLEWFNPECPFVRKHYDSGNMQGLQGKFTAQDVVWLSIDSSANGNQGYLTPEGAKQFIAEENVSSTAVLLDPQGKVGKLYGAKTTPHMFIIDPQGKVVYQGAIDDVSSTDADDILGAKNYVDETLSLALSGKPMIGFATKSYGCSVKY